MNHPLIRDKGWWQREIRLLHHNEYAETISTYNKRNTTPLLIVGKNGTLGRAFARICEDRGISYRLLSRQDLDICRTDNIEKAIKIYKPWAIVNAAGYVRVDDAENEIEKCFDDNTKGPELLASACNDHGIKFMTFSSDLVFDGGKKIPYTESDALSPLNVYGRSKAEAETKVTAICKSALVIRTSAFFGPWDNYNFVTHVVNSLLVTRHFNVINDVYISPTYVPDLVHTSLDLLIDNENGIWHVSNNGEITWADMAYEIARIGGYNKDLLMPRSLRMMNLKASRPKYSVLKSEKGIVLPSLDNALSRYFDAKTSISMAEAV
jgi:dTDP-4-dehydrorhamnose reductase